MTRPANYRAGALLALVTAFLLAVQEPFSALAARGLPAAEFVCLTQIALLLSVPILIVGRESRRDFIAVLGDQRNFGKLAILFLVGIGGLLLYDVGLSSAHPIITAGVLDLSPFWAALVAFVVSRKSIPGSPRVFIGCFVVAFCGAMAIAWSQLNNTDGKLLSEVLYGMLHSRWIFALPMPVFFALSGTLVGKWFAGLDESAVIGANFVVSAVVLIPVTATMAYLDRGFQLDSQSMLAILMLLVGTLASSAAGRVFYQVALTTTDNDNGFVTMFFLAIPVMSALLSMPLSHWIPSLHVAERPTFFAGMILVTAPLLVFSMRTWRHGESTG
jgi:hypothetical protein